MYQQLALTLTQAVFYLEGEGTKVVGRVRVAALLHIVEQVGTGEVVKRLGREGQPLAGAQRNAAAQRQHRRQARISVPSFSRQREAVLARTGVEKHSPYPRAQEWKHRHFLVLGADEHASIG